MSWRINDIYNTLVNKNISTKFASERKTINNTGTEIASFNGAVAEVDPKRGCVHFEASYDGTNYVPIAAERAETGTRNYRIQYKGTYFLGLSGVNHLRFVVDYSQGNTPVSCNVDLLPYDTTTGSKIQQTNKITYPNPPQFDAELKSEQWLKPYDLDLKTGVLYVASANSISKSDDYGDTFSIVVGVDHPWGSHSVDMVRVVENRLIAIVDNETDNQNEIYLSDENETNWQLVYSFSNGEGRVHEGWGIDVYKNIVLFAPYKNQPRLASDDLHIHASFDGGLTWDTIHTAPSIEGWHYHDVVFDPYRNRIWLCAGDSMAEAGVEFSIDFGETWERVNAENEFPIQLTSICPMPDVVLFGTDSPGVQGISRYIPHLSEFTGVKITELMYTLGPPGGAGNALMRPTKHFWDLGACYFLVNSPRSKIIGTKDGVNFYQVWETLDPGLGVLTLHGTDINNKMVVRLIGDKTHLVIDAPEWVEK